MKNVLSVGVLILVLASSGCFWRKKSSSEPAFQSAESVAKTQTGIATPAQSANAAATAAVPEAPASTPIVTPASGVSGKVSSAYAEQRFVVITFPVGQMARRDQRLDVYRGGLKVGELLVTGPQQGDSTVADITAGEAQKGDEVRSR